MEFCGVFYGDGAVSFAEAKLLWPTLPGCGGDGMASMFDCSCLRDALFTDDPVDRGSHVDAPGVCFISVSLLFFGLF